MVQFVLLILSAAATLLLYRQRWLALIPAVAGLGELLIGPASPHGVALSTLKSLIAAIGFLLAAGPLGWMLDRLGFFSLVASKLPKKSIQLYLWWLAALVTAVFNLDAAVVLLTPLYFRYASERGLSVDAFAFQPVLLSLLASSPLVGSNLTNLVLLGSLGLSPVSLLAHLFLPTLAGVAVGYLVYRRIFLTRESKRPLSPSSDLSPCRAIRPGALSDRMVVLVGGSVTVLMLLGMIFGRYLGIAPWLVVLVCDLILALALKSLPFRSVPIFSAVAIVGLGITAIEFGSRWDLGTLLSGNSDIAWVLISVGSGMLGMLVNNLPAISMIIAGSHGLMGGQVWPLLIGVNFLPGIVLTGTLANLLWVQLAGQLGIEVSFTRFSRVVGLVVGSGYVAAIAVMLVSRTVGL